MDAAAICRALYDLLLSLNGVDPAPGYATKWTVSPEGLTYTFDLHPDWKFSDGTPVKPEDYIFSCMRQRNNKSDASWLLGNVASMTKSGPNQVTIVLKSLDVDFLRLVPNPSLGVTNAAVVRAHGGTDAPTAATTDTATTWLDQHSVGTGPFMIDHWDRGSEMVLRANPYYWGPKTFETVVFRFVQDPTTQRDLLLRGDAHIAVNLTPDLAANLQKRGPSSKVAVATVPALGIAYLGFNAKASGPIGQPKAWEAIRSAIDYEGLKAIYLGGGQPTGSIVPPQLPNALPVAEGMKQDIPRAKAALAALGTPSGFSFKLTYGADQIIQNVPATDVAQKVKADLAAIGITAELIGEPLTQELTDYRAGKPEAVLHLWAVDYPGWTDFLPNYAPGGHVAKPRQNWTPDLAGGRADCRADGKSHVLARSESAAGAGIAGATADQRAWAVCMAVRDQLPARLPHRCHRNTCGRSSDILQHSGLQVCLTAPRVARAADDQIYRPPAVSADSVLLGMTLISFAVTKAIPTDPIIASISQEAANHPEIVAAYRKEWGLDKPLPVQYVTYVWNLLHGDMGVSIYTHRPVIDDLVDYLPATVDSRR